MKKTEPLNPKRYRAVYTVPLSDRFAGGNKVAVEGYYVKHVTATPPPIGARDQIDEFIDSHTKHYIFTDGFSDWMLPRAMKKYEIDIDTLEEVNDG